MANNVKINVDVVTNITGQDDVKKLQESLNALSASSNSRVKSEKAYESAVKQRSVVQIAEENKIKQIQMSYRNEFMKMQDLIKKTQDKINEGVGSYDVSAEYGISEDYYKSIIEKMNIQYENAMSEVNCKDFRFVELNSASSETNITSPLLAGKNTVILEENGWKYTAEILKKIPELEGDYIFYFELDDEKWSYNDFCIVVLHVIQDINENSNYRIEVARNRSKDGANHFWLMKK